MSITRHNKSDVYEFRYEKDMVDVFCSLIQTSHFPWQTKKFTTEFNYSGGKADILLLHKKQTLIALEAKLYRWREALNQAFRNTAFAHESYVLLPRKTALRAIKNREAFLKRNVGIIVCDEDQIELLLQPNNIPPIQPWLCEKAVSKVKETYTNAFKN